MPRLALNAVSINAGGGLSVLVGYLRAWQRIGADLDITVYASRSLVIDAVRRVRPDLPVISFGTGMGLLRRVAHQQSRLGNLIDDAGCDVALTTNMFVERCRTPQVLHHQNLLLFQSLPAAARQGPNIFVRTWLAKRSVRRSAANVFISEHLREQAERVVCGGRGRNFVIHNGLDQAVIDGAARPSEWDGRPALLAVTSQDLHKDNATLIRALARLVSLDPDVPWTLDVAFTGELARERKLAAKLGVADRVRWLGLVDADRLDGLYRRSLCMLFTSTMEGFGLPAIEAMARRCPVVACRSTAMPEVTGDASLLVDPSDAVAFADAARRILRSPELRQRLAASGVERIRKFSWDASSRRMLDVIRDVADLSRS